MKALGLAEKRINVDNVPQKLARLAAHARQVSIGQPDRRVSIWGMSSIEPWDIVFFESIAGADAVVPGVEFLDACPAKVAARIVAVLEAVAASPPPWFGGGGYWEAMHMAT